MSNQLVVYNANRQLSVLPTAIRTTVQGMQTIGQMVAYVRKTAWFLSKANNARRQILASLSSSKPSGIPSAPSNTAPVSINTRIRPRAARMRPGKVAGSMRITHREYLGEVPGNTTFGVVGYSINPGLPTVFPWLSGIANNFEKYKINSMRIDFVSIAATSERGRVTLACDYDVLDSVPNDKVEMFQIAGASESNVWSTESLTIKPSVILFTRSGLVAGGDLKTYDHGSIFVGVSNAGSTSVVGELFIEYDIELMIPQPAKCPSWLFSAGTGAFADVPISGASPMVLATGAASPTTGIFISGDLYVIVGASTLTFPIPGFYTVSGCIAANAGTMSNLVLAGTSTKSNFAAMIDNVRTAWFSQVRVLQPNQTYTIAFTGSCDGSITVVVTPGSTPQLTGP